MHPLSHLIVYLYTLRRIRLAHVLRHAAGAERADVVVPAPVVLDVAETRLLPVDAVLADRVAGGPVRSMA